MLDDTEMRDLTRFGDGAEPDARRAFARELMAKLDEVGVKPGDQFVVMPLAAWKEAEAAFDEKLSEIDRLEEDLNMARWDTDRVKELEEMIADFGRGIVTADELLDEVGARA